LLRLLLPLSDKVH